MLSTIRHVNSVNCCLLMVIMCPIKWGVHGKGGMLAVAVLADIFFLTILSILSIKVSTVF